MFSPNTPRDSQSALLKHKKEQSKMDSEKIRALALSENEISEIVDDFVRALASAASQKSGLYEAREGMCFRLHGLVPIGRLLDALGHAEPPRANAPTVRTRQPGEPAEGDLNMAEIDRGLPDWLRGVVIDRRL